MLNPKHTAVARFLALCLPRKSLLLSKLTRTSVGEQLDRLKTAEANGSGGMGTALRMAEESENIIFEYTDAQALEDGVLVEVSCGAVNRITSAVFYHFARRLENLYVDGLEQFDSTPVT